MGKPNILGVAHGRTVFTSLGQAIFRGDDHSRLEARHLLRALLRQCSYLPDSAARQYVHDHIIARYRKYYPRPPEIPNLSIQRRPTLIKQAHKALRFLERANDGHPSHLLKVLLMTYGRVGKRRRQMLHEIAPCGPRDDATTVSRDIPTDEKALAVHCTLVNSQAETALKARGSAKKAGPEIQGTSSPFRDSIDISGPTLGGRLEALAKSQRHQNHTFFTKPPIRNVTPKIAQKNSWGRQMPARRVLNLKERWYADILDKIQPPLDELEWDRLRDLVLGRISWEGPVPRRAKIASGMNEATRSNENNHVTANSFFSQDGKHLRPLDNHERFVGSNPHKITPRFMRSLWAKVFRQCPKMQWDPQENNWIVTWGNEHRYKDISLSANTSTNGFVFDGVDEKGLLMRLTCEGKDHSRIGRHYWRI